MKLLGRARGIGILSYGSRSSIRSWERAEVLGQKLNFVCALTLSEDSNAVLYEHSYGQCGQFTVPSPLLSAESMRPEVL